MKPRTEYSILFIVVVIAAFLYYTTQQLGFTRQEVIEIVLIIVFLVMACTFATLAVGKKAGDKQIIADLQKESALLSAKNAELQKKATENKRLAANNQLMAKGLKNIEGELRGLVNEDKLIPFPLDVPQSKASEKLGSRADNIAWSNLEQK